MKAGLARCLVSLYPRTWQAPYGEEFESVLQDASTGLRSLVNVLVSALRERFFPSTAFGMVMKQYPNSVVSLSKQPSAFVPIAMSLAALALVLGTIAIFGVVHEGDEGASAHIWQLLMAGQMPILAYFLFRWLPRVPRQTLCVMVLQIGAALAAMAPVYFLRL